MYRQVERDSIEIESHKRHDLRQKKRERIRLSRGCVLDPLELSIIIIPRCQAIEIIVVLKFNGSPEDNV